MSVGSSAFVSGLICNLSYGAVVLEPDQRNSPSKPIHEASEALPFNSLKSPTLRSLSAEIPFACIVPAVSPTMIKEILTEIAPDLCNLVSSELFDLINDGTCIKGSELISAYFEPTPLVVQQKRVFLLSDQHAPIEQLHAIRVVDTRSDPEYPIVELVKLDNKSSIINLRFELGRLSVEERWECINKIGHLLGISDTISSFQHLAPERTQTFESGTSFSEVSPQLVLETLSTLAPIQSAHMVEDLNSKHSRHAWGIEAIEYCQPDYGEQGCILSTIDPKQFNPQAGRNLLSSLIIHTASMYATNGSSISVDRLLRASKHLSTPTTVSFERSVELGSVDEEQELSDLDAFFASQYTEDADLSDELFTPEEALDYPESLDLFPAEDSQELYDDEGGFLTDSETCSLVRIHGLSSNFGKYSVVFASEATSSICASVNDDTNFDHASPVVRVEFSNAQSRSNRWNIIYKLCKELATMKIPAEETGNFSTLERDFSSSDISTHESEVLLYFGRMRIIASRF